MFTDVLRFVYLCFWVDYLRLGEFMELFVYEAYTWGELTNYLGFLGWVSLAYNAIN